MAFADKFNHSNNPKDIQIRYLELVKFEQDIINLHPGLLKNLNFIDIKIIVNQKECTIHTIHGGNKLKSNLVLIHGYGGSSVMFYKILPYLLNDFYVYCIDLIGMGASSREQFQYTSLYEVNELFVESIEQWRKAINIMNFDLLGHSLGGYISCIYAMQYKSHVRKLILVSPAAISKKLEDQSINLTPMTVARRIVYKFESFLFEKKISPFSILRGIGRLGQIYLRYTLRHKFKLNEEELIVFTKYFIEILKLPQSTEDTVHYIFGPGAVPIQPLEDILKEKIDVPVDIYFGEKDWMDWKGCYRFANEAKSMVRLIIITDASHHISLDNPKELSDYIVALNCKDNFCG